MLAFSAGGVVPCFGQSGSPLLLGPDDVRVEQRTDGGYHLFVRARSGIASILLTESTSDPAHRADTYSYRSLEWNPVNGDEQRIIGGKFIPRSSKIWSLIDSTPEPDRSFGRAFHIFIPWVVAWGYPWTRNGRVFIGDGSFIDIRVFAKPYADYSGAFVDNPFMLRVAQHSAGQAAAPPAASAPPAGIAPPAVPLAAPVPVAPPAASAPPAPQATAAAAPAPAAPPAASAPPAPQATPPAAPPAPQATAAAAPAPAANSAAHPTAPSVPAARSQPPKPSVPATPTAFGSYMHETVDAYYDIASSTGGRIVLAGSGADLGRALAFTFDPADQGSAEVVICLDTTESMQAPLDALRAALPGTLAR
ncbi:MAG TPA: hypothetical protein VMC79_11325, partial [Rectinemataceae bacterium]|nr:hypothetical protein [Rectinemataceae bacterium]